MKLYGEEIQVRADAAKNPVSVLWRRRPYRVQVVHEQWCYVGKWWMTSSLQGLQRIYYRITCLSPTGVPVSMEIYRHHGRWKLSRLLD